MVIYKNIRIQTILYFEHNTVFLRLNIDDDKQGNEFDFNRITQDYAFPTELGELKNISVSGKDWKYQEDKTYKNNDYSIEWFTLWNNINQSELESKLKEIFSS